MCDSALNNLHRRIWCVVLLTTLCRPANAQEVSFQRDIRPILSDHCFACHGPDANQRQAELRLDTHEGALTAINLDHPEQSELLSRIDAHDDEQMPPTKFNKPLSDQQIKKLKAWIGVGAKWESHWSFAPLKRPATAFQQDSKEAGYITRNPIDQFVQQKLQQRGWKQSAEADRRTLIRRLSLDLTGLPPTPQEVEQYLADTSADAYQTVVRRLLNSPAFGERMAWDWLDAARYADTNGYQGDNERTMWPWRDWVVQAFNQNLPFDQFTVWQLAGDLLPEATQDQKLATGFCRNHMINGEGGRIAEENRVDYVMDMTETMGTVWLGLTLNCCRCHDHKFDPIEQKEYYQLFAFFNQTPIDGGGGNPQTAPILTVPSQDQSLQLEQTSADLSKQKQQLRNRSEELQTGFADWLKSIEQTHQDSTWRLPEVKKAEAHRQKLTIQKDQSVLASGENPANDTYELELIPGGEVTVIRLDAMQHSSMTNNGLSRSGSGNFVLTGFELYRQTRQAEGKPTRTRIAVSKGEATFEQGSHTIQTALDEDTKSGWAVWEGRNIDRSHAALFRLKDPLVLLPDEQLVVVMKHESEHANHNVGYFRITTSSDSGVALNKIDPQLDAVLAKQADARTKEDLELLSERQRKADENYLTIERAIKALEDRRRAIENSIPKVMVMADQPKPRETFMLSRGLYNQPGDPVSAEVPQSLPKLPAGLAKDRLALARWLVSDEQPLTARVVVNRLWQQFFGIGLVKTVEDFGSQGEIPLQLELLDFLAAEYRDSHWDTKHLIELIVTSHTYRQSSSQRGLKTAIEDPENRWLARGPRFRMPSWMIRDQALAVSGLLTRTLGGPSVKGYQPAGVWEEASFGNKKYQQDSGDALYRRSLYIYWRRIIGPTMFFDNAARQVCTVKSVRTNTPLQALSLLNDVTFVEAARALATQLLSLQSTDDEGKLQSLFQRTLGRAAHPNEATILLQALARSQEQIRADPKLAAELLSVGESTTGRDLDPIEMASWTALSLAVLNLDEMLTKE
jgi:cytochrome c553